MNKLNKNLSFKGQLYSCPLLFYLVLFAVTPACSKKTIHQDIPLLSSTSAPITQSDRINQTEPTITTKQPHFKSFVNQAKEIDITTPVGFKLIKADSKTQGTQFFIYQGSLELEKIRSFYKRELELSGWDYKDLSTKHEGLFVANKTSKFSIISIRPQESGSSKICISIAVETEQTEQ